MLPSLLKHTLISRSAAYFPKLTPTKFYQQEVRSFKTTRCFFNQLNYPGNLPKNSIRSYSRYNEKAESFCNLSSLKAALAISGLLIISKESDKKESQSTQKNPFVFKDFESLPVSKKLYSTQKMFVSLEEPESFPVLKTRFGSIQQVSTISKDFEGRHIIEISKNIDVQSFINLIIKIVDFEEDDLIKEFVLFLKDLQQSPHVHEQRLWEFYIGNELIKIRYLELIKKVFPLFQERTLTYFNEFDKYIEKGDKELILALLEGGVKPFSSQKDFFLYSIFFKQIDLVKIFLQYGYDINQPYRFCVRYAKNHDELKPSYKFGDCITPAYLAVVMNDPNLLKFLIDLGADCSKPNKRPDDADRCRLSEHDANNPLTYAIENGQEECFNEVMKTKINVNVPDYFGTPLITACAYKKFSMARTLIDKGAFINASGSEGFTALMFAVRHSEIAMIQDLLQKGADPRCVNSYKENLWHIGASSKNPEEIYKILSKSGIEDMIDDEDRFGRTPLVIAVENCNLEAFKALNHGVIFKKKSIKLSDYTRKFLELSSEKVTLQMFAEAVLQKKLKQRLENTQIHSSQIEEIRDIREIINYIRCISPVFEINNYRFILESKEKIKNQIHARGRFHEGFVEKLSELLEDRFLTSLELVNTISLVYLSYCVDPKFKNFEINIPNLLHAFSSDSKLQAHLKALWEERSKEINSLRK